MLLELSNLSTSKVLALNNCNNMRIKSDAFGALISLRSLSLGSCLQLELIQYIYIYI